VAFPKSARQARLRWIQNAVFLCYIAVVLQGREATQCIARSLGRFSLPEHKNLEVIT
jgi:hypothetical protein